ncbi:polymorphic toxin-type HINT domain-containing protein [Actinoplanes sp. NPDC026619]|uniref:polymorphic toxin-type HINT domain-containing protein n=1 Tax=Actinoplanes sp. NPDC026619 TaxID=3155798 RepID=UPI0033E50809
MVIVSAPALTSMAAGEPAAAAPKVPEPTKIERVELGKSKVSSKPKARGKTAQFDVTARATLPAAQIATVAPSTGAVRAGSTPIKVRAKDRVQVKTADQKVTKAAGIRGVLFSVSGGAGAVHVDVDPSAFANAYGGGYASRLRLVKLPACALTTPELAQCRTQTPVAAALSADVSVNSVLAATSGTSGGGGDYAATSLSPGGSWSAGGNTGAFTYSYPISVPPGIGAVKPNIDLSYSSATQDARTAGTNSQSTWVGDGWSMGDNFVERTYRSCDDIDAEGAPDHSGDLCWAGQILTLSLNGESTSIVYDDKTHTFRSANDNATTQIDNLSDATNGTKNGEYFRVTQNGTQYYFGLSRLPGWSAGAEETKSVQTVPVYQSHAGVSDCPSGSFKDTACTLGYRFNLDYAVDRNGNAMAYYYNDPEMGYYGANMKDTAVSYVRASTIKRIDYGMTASTVYSATAPEQVVFNTAERCVGDCTFSESNPELYPDVPVDLNCSSGKDCTNHSPSFWTRRMLTSITTQVQVAGATKLVDRFDLAHSFPDNADHSPTLWLESIKRTGLDKLGGAATETSAGSVSFEGEQLANRVGVLPGLPKMYYNRIHTIWSETGAETVVEYATPTCAGLPPANPSGDDDMDKAAQAFAAANTTGCFPVYWAPDYQPEPLMDWFYTHPVTSVTTYDSAGNHYQDGTQPTLLSQYSYQGDPGWHYDDNEVVKKENRTWGQFRGYPEVDITTGNPSVFHYTDGTRVYDQKTLTKSYYFLGMDGDTLPDSKTRSVPALKSSDGTISVADKAQYSGQAFEKVSYNGGTIIGTEVTVPNLIGPTASRARDGLTALTAYMSGTAKTVTRAKVSYGWRKVESDTFYNTAGRPVQTADRGEVGATGNSAKCTFNKYLDSTVSLPGGKTAPVVLPSEVIITEQDCPAAGASPSGTLISDVRSSFDSRGNPTLVQTASAATGSVGSTFIDTAKTTYDSYGRVTSATRTPNSTAADGTSLAKTGYTKFTPATGALPTSVTAITQVTPGASCAAVTKSSKDCQLSTVTIDAARQLTTATTGITGAVSSVTYDALGRTTAAWMANKSKSAGAPASILYGYQLSSTGPSVVTTKSLLDNDTASTTPTYGVSKTLYDALLRPLETQSMGENGSTIVSDTQYDTHGWTVLTNNSYAIAGDPRDTLVSDHLSQVSIPSTLVNDHDAAGRITQTTAEHNGLEIWHSRTAYTGDKVIALPQPGGVATATATDGRGQLIELLQYTTPPTLTGSVTGGFTATGGTGNAVKYSYTPAGQQSTVTGPDQAVWSDTYDLLGRVTSHVDPDTGTSYSSFDDAGNLVSTKDARGVQLTFTYDLLGRKLSAVDKTAGNFKYASWDYDTLQIGKLTSSTRYVSGVTGGYTVAATGYSVLGNPLGQTITLPGVERPLPTSYTTKFTYTPNTEKLSTQEDPAVGTLPGETISYGHDLLGAPTRTSGIDLYVAGTIYTDFGQPSKTTMGDSTNEVQSLYTYDDYTLRLATRSIYRSHGIGPLIDQSSYAYDDSGNPLSTVNKQSESGNTVTDTQCYRYDSLSRLINAWTAAGDCPGSGTAAPAVGDVSSSSSSYWQTFGYNLIGNRTQLVDHATGTASAGVTTNYVNGCTTACNPTGAQPHSLTETKDGSDPTKFVYDVAGHLLTRTATSGNNQTLKWDDEGRLAQVTATGTNAGTTKYLYDADGNQLIRRDPGRTSLFAGDTEIVADTAAAPAVLAGAVRTYNHGGSGAVAIRSTLPNGGTHYLFGDRHGTASLAIDTTSLEVSRQQFKPYGEDRATANTALWPNMTRGYLNAPRDLKTGYTDVGARKYDPALGRFISADPLLQAADPAQLGGYTYSGDNPITGSDPSGLGRIDGDRSGCARGNGGTCGGYVLPDDDDDGGGDGGNSDPAEVETDGYGNGSVGGVTVTTDQVDDIYAYGNQVNYAYYMFRDSWGKKWDALDDNVKLLKMMDWACQQMVNHCTTVYANAVHDANIARVVAANGGDPEFSQMLHMAVTEEGGASASTVGRMLASTRTSMRSFDMLDDMARGAGKACVNSFAPGTLVKMADRPTKPIERVKVGDEVLATDPETGETSAQKVTELHVNIDTELVDLKVDTGRGSATVHTTKEHPFWDPERLKWTSAGDLEPGENLGVAHPGVTATIGSVREFRGPRTMYNLTIANFHTYYVLAGRTPVLVHNCDEVYTDVALGLRKYGLEQSATENNHTHFLNETREDALASVRDVANNHPETTIHVRMDGFKMTNGKANASPAELFDDAYREGGGDNWFTTQREMNILGRAVRLQNRDWNTIKFTMNGRDVSFPKPDYLGG